MLFASRVVRSPAKERERESERQQQQRASVNSELTAAESALLLLFIIFICAVRFKPFPALSPISVYMCNIYLSINNYNSIS